MATTIWKGHLTFGLISVPIKLFAAARTETVSFNQIHAPCGSRIKMQTFCPTCNRTVERRELQKGYEVESGRYIIIEESDLEKMIPPSGKTLEVQSFVKLADVDPIYFNTSYYMVADGAAGEKAYYLLVQAMVRAGYAGIAKITMHQREHMVIVRPALDGLMLHTLYYADEVRKIEEYGHPEKVQVADKELELAQMFIQALAAPFDPEQYRDRYRDNVRQMIQAKAQGLEVKAPAPLPQAPIMDLMAALKASIEQSVPPASAAVQAQLTAAAEPPAAAATLTPATAAPSTVDATTVPVRAAEVTPADPRVAAVAAPPPAVPVRIAIEDGMTTAAAAAAAAPVADAAPSTTEAAGTVRNARKKPPVRVSPVASSDTDTVAQ